jgi:hypothetical protein
METYSVKIRSQYLGNIHDNLSDIIEIIYIFCSNCIFFIKNVIVRELYYSMLKDHWYNIIVRNANAALEDESDDAYDNIYEV